MRLEANHLLLAALFAISPVATAFAQQLPSHLRYEFIFDDFLYFDPVDYVSPANGSGGSYGTILGPNHWIVATNLNQGDVARSSQSTRAWYSWLWPEHSNFITTETDSPFSIRTTQPHNYLTSYAQSGSVTARHPVLTSGFTSSFGTWMVKGRLSPLPPLQDVPASHVFFLQSPNSSLDTRSTFDGKDVWTSNGRSWFEANFEIWNEFKGSTDCKYQPGLHPTCSVSTGISWNQVTYRGVNPVLRAHEAEPNGNGGCRVGDVGEGWGDGTTKTMDECNDIITNLSTPPGGQLPAYLLIRITPEHSYHEVTVIDEEGLVPGFGWLHMFTFDHEHIIPPHPMRTMLGLEIGDGTLPQDISTSFDYFIFTPRTNIDFWQLRQDASEIQGFLWHYWGQSQTVDDLGRAIIRMNTSNNALRYPHISREEAEGDGHPCLTGYPGAPQLSQ